MKITLEITEGPESGRRLLLETGEECVVGRVDGDFLLGQDRLISGRHMFLKNDGSTLLVTDLNSRNHVYIDGKQIQPNLPIAANNGSQIVVGRKTKMRVFMQKSRPTPEEPKPVASRPEPRDEVATSVEAIRNKRENDPLPPVDYKVEQNVDVPPADPNADLLSSKFTNLHALLHGSAASHSAPSTKRPAGGPSNYVERKTSPGPSPGAGPVSIPAADDSRTGGGSSNFTDSFYQPANALSPKVPGLDSHRQSLEESSSFSMIEDDPPRFTTVRMDNGAWLFQGLTGANSVEAIVTDLLKRLTEVSREVFSIYPASTRLSSSTALESATPLFDWLPDQIARTNGPLLVSGDLVADKREIAASWNTESIVTFLGTDVQDITDWLTKLVRINTKTGEPGNSILGICWPGFVGSVIERAGKSEVELIFGSAISGILVEDEARENAWKLYSKDDLSQQLSILGLVAENE